MNQVAAAGGAQPGYAAAPQAAAPEQGDPNNHLQLMDPKILQALVARFQPQSMGTM